MPSVFEFCLPTSAAVVPDRPGWLHEVKYDGYRLIVRRDGNRVRLITRGGYDWSDRFPWIVETALKNRHQQFVIDGEAVVLDGDGISDFDALHARRSGRTLEGLDQDQEPQAPLGEAGGRDRLVAAVTKLPSFAPALGLWRRP